MVSLKAACALVLASVAAAGPMEKRKGDRLAAQLTWPASRGTDAATAGDGPCQGWRIGSRVEYPMSGGKIGIEMTSNIKEVQYSYSTVENPQSQSDFTPFGTNMTHVNKGTRCSAGPDLSGTGVKSGDHVTLQFSYYSGPKNATRYECADLIVLDNDQFAALDMTIDCTNTVTSTNINGQKGNPKLMEIKAANASESEEEVDAASGRSSSSGSGSLTVTEAGLVGAFSATGFFMVITAVAWFFGIVTLRNKKERAIQHNERLQHEVKSLNSA